MIEGGLRRPGDFTDLDAFYRSCLARGLDLYTEGRGLLPAGLIEEIRALQQPVIPWDVKLAQWFDAWFPAIEQRRTYARPSRRQASTPEIPRPRYVTPLDLQRARTFGVVLDTSRSTDVLQLGKALGAIAAYADSHSVPRVRVGNCGWARGVAGSGRDIPPRAGRISSVHCPRPAHAFNRPLYRPRPSVDGFLFGRGDHNRLVYKSLNTRGNVRTIETPVRAAKKLSAPLKGPSAGQTSPSAPLITSSAP